MRRQLCDAHAGVVYAVAEIRVNIPGEPVQSVSLCAHHLALFEAEMEGWGPAA